MINGNGTVEQEITLDLELEVLAEDQLKLSAAAFSFTFTVRGRAAAWVEPLKAMVETLKELGDIPVNGLLQRTGQAVSIPLRLLQKLVA